MYQRKQEKDIFRPLEYGMELFGGKWSSRIICMLAALDMPAITEQMVEVCMDRVPIDVDRVFITRFVLNGQKRLNELLL